MRTHSSCIVIVLFTFLISCEKAIKTDNITDNIKTIKVDLEEKTISVNFDEFFASSNIIALETNNESIFSQIDRISLYDNKVFILDSRLNGVFIFDNEGVFLNKIQYVGKGPQEYNSLLDFAIDEKNNTIILYTDRPYGLYIYKLNGDFIRKIKLNNLYHHVSSINEKIILLNKNIDRKYMLFEYNSNNNEEAGFLEINDKDEIYDNYSIIGRPCLTKDKNIHLSFPYSETIYQYSENGLKAEYYIDFGTKKMPENIYREKKSFRELFNYGRKNNYGYGICNFRENKNYITFNCQVGKVVIYSKITKKSKVLSIIKNDDMTYGSYIAHDGNDNKFVSICRAETFKTQMSRHKDKIDRWKIVPDKIKQINAQVSEQDNPLLLIYTFKE